MKKNALPPRQINSLIRAAVAARKNAHAPYSKFHVGAAVLMAGGRVYTGCNVENASYGATICAERVAITKAISEGEKQITAIAIVAEKNAVVAPCGMCRQVISEFCSDAHVILANTKGAYRVVPFASLLPEAFVFKKRS
jgi:cytidine deaminase